MSARFAPLAVAMLLMSLSRLDAQSAASSSVPTYGCFRASGPIIVDGLLVERDWNPLTVVHLNSWDGKRRENPPTSAWMCWDDTNLYVAFNCTDSDVQGRRMAHDAPIYEGEVVEVFLDPTGEGKSYYEFAVNPAGSTLDARFQDVHDSEGLDPKHWNCTGFTAAVMVFGTLNSSSDHDAGWTAELAIPFAALDDAGNRPPQQGESWHVNLCRTEFAPEGAYYLTWSPTLTPKPDFHVPARYGVVRFAGSAPQRIAPPYLPSPTSRAQTTPPARPVSTSVIIVAIAVAFLITIIVALKQRVPD